MFTRHRVSWDDPAGSSARARVLFRFAFLFVGTVAVQGASHASVPFGATNAYAQSLDDDRAARAAREAINGLWSPYCPGLMLEVCTSQGGADMRDSIAVQARSGMSSDSIVDFWVARFGEKYRAEPDFSGVGRFAWLTPYAALLAGVLVAAGVLAGRRSRTAAGPVAEVTPAQEERLTAALAELDRSEAPDF